MQYLSLIKTSFRFASICVLAFLVPSCDKKTFDSKIRFNPSINRIFWLDDDRVLTTAGNGETCQSTQSGVQDLMQILEFDTRKDSVSWYGSPRAFRLCYANGNISFERYQSANGTCLNVGTYFSGPYGQEKDIGSLHADKVIDYFNCSLQPNEKPSGVIEKRPEALPRKLVEGHGWILGTEIGLIYDEDNTTFNTQLRDTEHPNYPIAIYPEINSSPIHIDTNEFKPWIEQGYHALILRYEKYKDAYLLGLYNSRAIASNENNRHGQFWWLYPDGRLETIINFESKGDDFFSTVGLDLIPTKAGLFVVGGVGDPNLRYKNGLYKQTPKGDFELVVRGEIKRFALSPNGCKLAFGINPRPDINLGVYYLQAIDLCKPT
jgi:hypothetical protein